MHHSSGLFRLHGLREPVQSPNHNRYRREPASTTRVTSGFCAVPKPFPKTIEGPPAASTRVDVIAESKLQGLPLPSNNAVNPQALHYMLWPPSSCTCWTKRFFPPCLAAYMARSASANIFSGDGGELVNVIPPMLKVTGYSCTAIEF